MKCEKLGKIGCVERFIGSTACIYGNLPCYENKNDVVKKHYAFFKLSTYAIKAFADAEYEKLKEASK